MRIPAVFFLFFVGWTLFSCKKPTLNDTEVIPKDELGLSFTDTLTINAFTVREDSVTVKSETSDKVVGTLQSSYFGNTHAGFYAQFYPPSGLVLNPSYNYVSLVLSMPYDYTYGDVSTPLTINVYELDERIYADKEYYSDQTFQLKSQTPIGSETVVPNLTDSVEVNGLKQSPQLRILLDPTRELGSRLLSMDSLDFADTTRFYDLFKGLYITSDSTTGNGLIFFQAPYIKLSLYYQVSAGDPIISKDFVINIRGLLNGSVNHYSHNYTGSVVAPYIKPLNFIPTNEHGDSITFLEPLAGLNTKIFVPYIRNLGNIVITKAELVINGANPLDNNIFPMPKNLTVASADEDGNQYGLADQLYFGGGAISDSAGLYTYKFNLPRYYQSITDTMNTDFGIFILPANRTRVGNRAVIFGGDQSVHEMKLNLTYTKIQ